MLSLLLPAVETRFVLPLVRTTAQHQRILLPDTAPGQVEPGILECLSKVQPFRICMEDVVRYRSAQATSCKKRLYAIP